MWRKWNSCALTVRLQNGADTEEDSLVILQKVKYGHHKDPAVALLGTCPKEMKTCIYTKPCT